MAVKRITLKEAAKLRAERGTPDKDVLTAKDIAAIKDTETLEKAAQVHSGRVLNDLLKNSRKGDTAAAKEILERGHGKVAQGIKLTGEFTIKALHAHVLAPVLDAPSEQKQLTPAPTRARRARPARL